MNKAQLLHQYADLVKEISSEICDKVFQNWSNDRSFTDLASEYIEEQMHHKMVLPYSNGNKHWEILRFSSLGKPNPPICLEEIIIDESYRVQSILRLTDNTVFTIGDIITISKESSGSLKISDIILTIHGVRFGNDSGFAYSPGESLIAIKCETAPIILTTTDGVDITNPHSMTYWLLPKQDWPTKVLRASLCAHNSHSAWLKFSTETGRNEYILDNKPVITRREILGAFAGFQGDMNPKSKLLHLINEKFSPK